MLIACPNCAKTYQLDASAIGTRGRSVRCVRCRSVWFAASPVAAAALRTPEPASDEVVTAFRSELGPGEAPAQVAEAPPIVPEAGKEPEPPPAKPAAKAKPEAEPPAAAEEPAAPAEPQPAPEEPLALAEPMALADIPIPVSDAPPLAPGAEPTHPIEPTILENSDIESIARRRRTKSSSRRLSKSKTRLPLLIAALAVVCAALLIWRKDVVRHAPQMASFYSSIGLSVNLRGLAFTDVKVGRETHDNVPVLVVEGTIVNTVSAPVEVPRLRFALRNAAGAEVYSWTAVPSQTVLEPGATLPFRSRLASPPDDGQDVQVRFFTRRDVTAGLH